MVGKFFRLMILSILFETNIFAMESYACEGKLDILASVFEYTLDFLWRPNPIVPASCLQADRNLMAISHTCKKFRQLSLIYAENLIINSLLKFDSLNKVIKLNRSCEADIVAACCAFKIISRIREIVVPSFCEPH